MGANFNTFVRNASQVRSLLEKFSRRMPTRDNLNILTFLLVFYIFLLRQLKIDFCLIKDFCLIEVRNVCPISDVIPVPLTFFYD